MNNWIYIVGGIGMFIVPIAILFSGNTKKKKTAFETRKRPSRKETHINPLKTQRAAKLSKDTLRSARIKKFRDGVDEQVQAAIGKSSLPPKPAVPPPPGRRSPPPLAVDGGAAYAAFVQSTQVGSPRVTTYPYNNIHASGNGCIAMGSVTSNGNGSFVQGYITPEKTQDDYTTELRQEIIDEYKKMVIKQDDLLRVAQIDELKAKVKSINASIDSAEHAGMLVAETNLKQNLHQTKINLQKLLSEGMYENNLEITTHRRNKSKPKKREKRYASNTGPR